jgi:hypothetical protein
VRRWSASRTSAGGRPNPARAAVPASSCHRRTRGSRCASSRRRVAASGSISKTARAAAARGWPLVWLPAAAGIWAPARRARSSVSTRVASAISRALTRSIRPSRRAQAVPGSRMARLRARSRSASAVRAVKVRAAAISSPMNSLSWAGNAPAGQVGCGRRAGGGPVRRSP